MDERTHSFGYWLRRRRKALDLTQEELADSVSCSRAAIRKIEADERRPSRRLAERLAERLGIPAAERGVFVEAARALRPAERLPLEAQPLDLGAAAPHSPEADLGFPLVGRSNELGQLVGLLARVTSGEGHTVLIEGEPGIGKSRLLQEIAGYAATRGIRTLRTNCYEIERGMPYQPVIDLVTQAVGRSSNASLRKMPAIAAAEIAALVPSVAERFANLPALSTDFPELRQARLFQAIARLFDTLGGERQLLVSVDDIHWVDDASRQFLHYLACRISDRPLLLVFTYRGEEVDSDESLAGFVQSLRREPHTRHFPLARLTLADAVALLQQSGEQRLRTAGLAAWLHRESEGNPLFMTSLLHSLSEQDALPAAARERGAEDAAGGAHLLPQALRDSVRARISRLPREVRGKLEIAAVLGRRFDFELLHAVAQEPQAVLLQAIEFLVRRQLLREEEEAGVYDFSHDKVREVVYLDIGVTRRMLLHRAVAEALERHPVLEVHERTAGLAEHYERGQVWSRAIHSMVQAAEQSQRLFAMREALGWFDRAVALAEAHPEAMDQQSQLALIERRGAARAQAGQTAGAVADFERVIRIARSRGAREHLRDLLIELGMAYRRADAYEQATACLDEALAASRAMGDERHAADTLYHLGTVAWSNGRNHRAIQFHQEAVEICERLRLTDLVAVQAFHGRGEAHFANAEPAAAIDCFTRSLEYARAIGDRSYESENLMMIGWASIGIMGLADYRRALEYFDSALQIALAADLQWHLGPTFIGRDHTRACLGEYRAAWAGLNETLQSLESLKLVRYQIMAHTLIGQLLLDLNRNEQAATTLKRGLSIAREAGVMFWLPGLEAGLAIARVRRADLGVQRDLERALAVARENSERHSEARCLEALAEFQFRRGDSSACAGAAGELLALAEPNGLREFSVIALRWQAEAWMEDGRHDAAREALGRAAELSERIGRLRLSWDVHRSLARLARRTGSRPEEHQHLTAAQDIAARIERDLSGSELRFEPLPEPA